MAERVSHGLIHFSGRVQGVGFRYATLEVARGFEVAGVVENLFDGRVRLEIEAEEAEARAFVKEVQVQLSAFIRQTEELWDERERSFRGFEIASTRR